MHVYVGEDDVTHAACMHAAAVVICILMYAYKLACNCSYAYLYTGRVMITASIAHARVLC